MSNIVQKVLIDIEVKKAKQEMAELAKTSGDTKTAMAALDARAKELEKSLNGIKHAGGNLAPSLKSLANLTVALNQGLEVAGKALKFAEEGLEAYAKTSAQAAEDVRGLTTEFASWKRTVMEGAGEIAVELGKAFPNPDQLQEIVKRMDQTKKSLHDAAADVFRETKGAGSALDAAFGFLSRTDFGAIADGIGNKVAGAYKKAADEANKATIESARWRAEFLKMQEGNNGRNYLDTIDKPGIGAQIDLSGLDQGGLSRGAIDDLAASQAALSERNSRGSRYAASAGNRNDSYLATMFGPIEEFQAYATAFGTLSTATQSAMSAWISGSESLGTAIKKGLGVALAGLASSMAVEALKHGAYALGSLAFGDVSGAARHGAAAAAFGGGAAAAAIAAKQLGGGGSTGAASGDHRTSGGRSDGGSVNGGGTGTRGGNGKSALVVVYADPFAEGSPGTRRRNAKRVLARAKGGNDWEDS